MDWFDLTSADTKSAELAIKRVLSMSADPHNIFTPFELCKEIVEKIPSTDGTNLVVANLEFVYTMKKRGVDVSRLYFATPCPVKMKAALSILPTSNVFKYETVISEKDVDGMKFDVIIGNPPFQEGDTGVNKTLYHKFYHQCLPLLSSAGTLVFITPTTWLRSTKPMLQELNQVLRTKGLYDITPLNPQRVFGITVDSLGVVWVNKAQHSRLAVEAVDIVMSKLQGKTPGSVTGYVLAPQRGRTRQLTKAGQQAHNGKGNVTHIKDALHHVKTLNRVSDGMGNPEIVWCDTVVDDDSSRVRVVYGIISTNKNLGPIHILDGGENLTQMCCYIPVATLEEAANLKTYMTSTVFNFMLNQLRSSTTNSLGVIRQIPAIDVSRPWTDEDLYEYFSLTPTDISLIEETVK